MRRALFALLVLVTSGCALVAGLRDRDAPDDAGSTSDATAEGGGADGGGSDAPAADADALSDAPIPNDGRADAPADASDGGAPCVPGAAGAVFCAGDAACAEGCCVEAGACASIVACPGNHLTCDGPEDCQGGMQCCAGSSTTVVLSVCSQGCGGTTMCHSNCECPDASPICCPYAGAAPYARCATACP